MKYTFAVAVTLSSTLLVSCASTPEVDNTPLIRTAVVKSTIQNGGIKGFLANQTDRSVSVMDQISRIDNQIKFTGSILGRVAKKQSQSDIVRLDRGVEWSMDNRRKTYRECPLGGCETASYGFESLQRDDGFENEEIDESCKITVTDNALKMAPTGAARNVNGYQATEHLLQWTIRGNDDQGKTFHSEISVTNWMTPITGDIAEAVNMHASFDRNYRSKLAERYPDNAYRVIPPEVFEIFFRQFTAGMSEAEVQKLLNKFTGLKVPEGYSVSNKLTWEARNETCAEPPEPKDEEKDTLDTGSIKGLLASVGKQVIKQEIDKKKAEKAREIALSPILSILTDVTSIEILDIRESQLTVPTKYKLLNRS
ncbi:MAG: hypothetical protein KTR32_10630 [Granulosicoccus sp.]|nr:hypothetical protein [Granulosicoccus sp.]